MGDLHVRDGLQTARLRTFVCSLLTDLHALETLIADGRIETGVRRIGAEQEVFLVSPSGRPASRALDVLGRLGDSHFTTELGLFNLEINLEPVPFGRDCFSSLESQLEARLSRLRTAAQELGCEVTLSGILPTLRKSDLSLDNLTPKPRYFALNAALSKLRERSREFRLKGADEIAVKHDSMMLEACCTSFQAHLQVGSEEFPRLYNVIQVATAPVLAAACNSPLLFGRRLWKETRVPLFQQAVDTRNASPHLREETARVSFGQGWVRRSVLELFREDVARFPPLLIPENDENPFALLREGHAPALHALRIHNGSVYRWNRPCYGVLDGKPHLRIETRALPAGPTVVDQVANAVFLYGLTLALAAQFEDITRSFDFADAESNFLAAARLGLEAQLTWLNGRVAPASWLIVRELLPQAREGLRAAGIQSFDVDRYLGIIEERVASGRTGAAWLVSSLTKMQNEGTREQRLSALTQATWRRQWSGLPVHEWSLADLEEGAPMRPAELRVEEIMTTDLFTVSPDEPLELVAELMEWKRVRHVPVEDAAGRLVGILSCFEVLRELSRKATGAAEASAPVSAVMSPTPITVPAETPMPEALALMRERGVDYLLVVSEGRLVGIVTEHDFVKIVERLLKEVPST